MMLNPETDPRNAPFISHSRPYLDEEEVKSIEKVLRSGLIAQGEEVKKFEKAFCEKLGLGHGVAVSSGSAALHLALIAVGVKSGDEVIIPSYVCSALLQSVRSCGAVPVVADVDPKTGNIDPADVKKRVSPRTRALIVPHMFGFPAAIDRLLALDIPLIEDCAQAIGSTWRKKPVGSFGAAAVYSFYATKVMTTGEGGMVVSGSRQLVKQVLDLRDYDKKARDAHRFNYKMTDIQAALGLAQIRRLDFFIDRRREIARRYTDAFKALDLDLPPMDPGHIYFRYIIGLNRRSDLKQWIQELRHYRVHCEKPVFKPIHEYLGLSGYQGTDRVHDRCISIPIYPALKDEEISRVIRAVTAVYQKTAGAA